MFNTISDTDPLDALLRVIKRAQQGPPQSGPKPSLPGSIDLGGGIPIARETLDSIGFDKVGTFSLSNGSSTTLIVGGLSTAGGASAIHGCHVVWQCIRGSGATARNGGGMQHVVANYYNGTGYGAWVIGDTNQGDVSHRSGVSIAADINSDNLRLTWTADSSGDDVLGQYWIKTFPVLRDTAP